MSVTSEEDCISRQAVDKLSRDLVHITRDKADFLCNFWEGLNALPSVIPQRKRGKWNFIGDQMFECSSCKRVYTQNQFEELRIYTTDDLLPKFCPNCSSYNGGGVDATDD